VTEKGVHAMNTRTISAFSGALAPMLTLALLLAVSASPALALSRENNVYFEPQTVYLPECGNATVQIMLDATDEIDTWSTIVEFDYESVNITGVRFAGGITPTYADWRHHTDHVYIGGTDLNESSGTGLLLATITLECNRTGTDASAGASTSPLHFAGEEGIERLIAGETVHPATWTDGAAQSVKRGNVNCAGDVDMSDVALLLNHVYDAEGYPLSCEWAGDINGAGEIDMSDVALLLNHVYDAEGYPLSCE
jgi:hypothetical protein